MRKCLEPVRFRGEGRTETHIKVQVRKTGAEERET
jgi:hypothetical protein